MSNGKIEVRKVTTSEVEQLQKIGKQSFDETFASSNNEANMQAYLDSAFSLEKLKIALSNPHVQCYFATLNHEVVGYLKVNLGSAQTETADTNSLEIERIYVLKQFHGLGIGQLLLEKALEVSKQNAVSYVWLGVWNQNPRAIRFYEKNGFVAFDKHIFKLGDDEQTDIMMKLIMRESNNP